MKPLKLSALALAAALALGACSWGGAGQPAATGEAQAPAPPAASEAPVLQATAGAPSAPTAEATAAPAPTAEVPPPTGAMVWRDQVLRSDTVIFSVSGLAAPDAGRVYAGWLASDAGSLPLGPLGLGGGAANLVYVSPTQDNLLGRYDRVYVADVPEAMATTALTNVVLAGALPEGPLGHIRQILFQSEVTPGRLGFALGLRQEADEVFRHAQFLRDAYNAGDFFLERGHAEHIVNIIEGAQGGNFGDLRGDGKIQNPGDGFGLLQNGDQAGYIAGMREQAAQALASAEATEQIRLHAQHVQIAGENVRVRLTDVRDRALRINQAGGIADTQQDVLNLTALAEQAIQGVDLNLDEQVSPIPGEGGTLTAYQHALLMARIDLSAAAQVEAPAPVQQPQAPQLEKVIIRLGDDVFVPNKITIPVSATVVWQNEGQRAHTVTSDAGLFDSGALEPGGSFEQSFDAADRFAFFCQIHGEKGGVGMSGMLIVAEQSAAAEPAPAPAAAAPQDSSFVVASGGEAPVAVNDSLFTPNRLMVPAGTTVVWTHQGRQAHTVTADDGSFASGDLAGGASFRQTFEQPGTFLYYCELHGNSGAEGMAGVIVVTGRPPP